LRNIENGGIINLVLSAYRNKSALESYPFFFLIENPFTCNDPGGLPFRRESHQKDEGIKRSLKGHEDRKLKIEYTHR